MSSVISTTETVNRGIIFSSSEEHGKGGSIHTLSEPLSHNQEPDKVEISITASERLKQEAEKEIQELNETGKNNEKHAEDLELSREDQKVVEKLRNVDSEVRTHELAHKAAAGRFASGGASFNYTIGPDGKKYAVGGHVSIDTSVVPNDPDATIKKARSIRSAALAPANPSSQDRSVAASAAKMEINARVELKKEQEDESDDVTQVNVEENAMDVSSILESLIKGNKDTFHSVGSSLDIQV